MFCPGRGTLNQLFVHNSVREGSRDLLLGPTSHALTERCVQKHLPCNYIINSWLFDFGWSLLESWEIGWGGGLSSGGDLGEEPLLLCIERIQLWWFGDLKVSCAPPLGGFPDTTQWKETLKRMMILLEKISCLAWERLGISQKSCIVLLRRGIWFNLDECTKMD